MRSQRRLDDHRPYCREQQKDHDQLHHGHQSLARPGADDCRQTPILRPWTSPIAGEMQMQFDGTDFRDIPLYARLPPRRRPMLSSRAS